MITGRTFVIFASLLLGFIFLYRCYAFRLNHKLRLVLFLCFLFAVSFLGSLIRIYVFSHVGLDLTNLFPLVLSVGTGQGLPLPSPSDPSLVYKMLPGNSESASGNSEWNSWVNWDQWVEKPRSSSPSTFEVTAGPSGQVAPAGPSHQNNTSLEASMRNRIIRLEQDNSPYLLDKAKGEYWAMIKQELDHTSSQSEYNWLLKIENRDLQIRERKHECFRLFNRVLAQHPPLADQAPYNPQEAFDDFLNKQREELDKEADFPVGDRAPGQGVSLEERDREEIAFLDTLLRDLQNSGPDAVKKIFDSPSH